MSKLPSDLSNLEFHPFANLFPLIEGEAFEALVADIKQCGLRENIILFEGKIIDGRNRYRAMLECDYLLDHFIEVKTKTDFIGGPMAWVLSKNLHRRHLSESQRAMVAGRIANMVQGERTDIAKEEPSANLPKVSTSEAAKKLKVSTRSVGSAKKVIEHGAPELQEAVSGGQVAVSTAAEIATLPMDEQIAAIESADPKAFAKVAKTRWDEKTKAKKAARVARERELGAKQVALPARKFGVIYADPEWKFEPYSAETGMDRAADNHYATSELATILARNVQDIAADDCVLFLWATVPMDLEARAVMAAWGFEYKSHFVWNKERVGNGYWNRNKHEVLLVGTRGNVPAPAMGTQWDSVIDAPVGAHSAKPEIFHFLIESYFPTLPKIELNARGVARDGWCAWGNETEGDAARGITLVDGVSDASHLALPPLVAPLPSPAPPPVGTKTSKQSKNPTKAKAKNPPKPKPLVGAIKVKTLNMLVRFADEKLTFYATDRNEMFPAETGAISFHSIMDVETDDLARIAAATWNSNFGVGDFLDWFLPTTVYETGRRSPVPVSGGAK